MFLMEKDCILYRVTNDFQIDKLHSITPKRITYDKYDISYINNQIIRISYKWLDPIKVQEKIISREPKSVVLIYFVQRKIICCFGSSESYIGFVISKLEKKLATHLEKINLFDICKKKYINEDNWESDLVSIYLLQKKPNSFDDYESTRVKKVKINDIGSAELRKHLINGEVTSFTYYFNERKTYFYLDSESVVSFPDVVKEEVVYHVIESLSDIV
ncbi:hypothetical protein OCD85_23155 [Bacillus pacificus]|uniref:Uncharacterized protein n=1 Tax=Bacillus cereus TaxID=1396 RepID=A0A9X0MEV6_BACCE|nr:MULTISPECIES: hypothetical protein [Bacillus cereus group]EMA6344105.1 hypothetical protein [Bacillus cytotoxicus]MDA1586170.1 hypothetical protein [Bacillus cereus group sp. TH230-1LC]KXY36159.1 hypothetical protein AT268_34325 [Bacillus cereus]MCU5363846.1 hypothetical protein [Bacillus pacificus]MCU5401289.1 hypothetical protein [Bacillus pacificus]